MNDLFLTVRRKVIGDATAPWYTRWWWAIVLAVLFLAVGITWFVLAKKEARLKAKGRTAADAIKRAQIKAEGAASKEEANRYHREAVEKAKKAADIHEELEAAAARRKSIAAAIKGADSWEELEQLEQEVD